MEFSIRKAETGTEIHLNGQMTFADHEAFRNVITAIDGKPGHRMVFDLSGLELVDSSGLGMLLLARDTAERKRLAVALRGARGEVQRLITIARFDRVFDIAA